MLERDRSDRPQSGDIREDLEWLADMLHQPQPRKQQREHTGRWTPPLGGIATSPQIVAGEIGSGRATTED